MPECEGAKEPVPDGVIPLFLTGSTQEHYGLQDCTVVRATHRKLGAEVHLAERCGPRLADALSGVVAHQELLFPGGSMEAVLPVYEDAVGAAFYNGCVVAAIEATLSLLPEARHPIALEVGAGSGGTASSILPVLEVACERYVFTDVSEVFLRQARVRFQHFRFLEYALLNIDADPPLLPCQPVLRWLRFGSALRREQV
jgi:hypothetical protein